jgi:transposase
LAWAVCRKKGLLTPNGRVYFVDAAHLLHNAVPSHGWIKRNHRVELPTNSGRSRLNVLGAYSPDDHSLIVIEDTASCDAEMVCRLLHKLRATHADVPLLLVLDNVRYQRAKRVQELAEQLQITLLFLPPYSPNLNLIERFWKFLRKHTTRNRFYATFAEFRAAIQRVIFHVDDYADELASLMTERFQLFGQCS